MHMLATTTATLDDLVEPVDLRQAPAPIAVLSFSDSDLTGLAAAWRADADALPALRLAPLRDLRHPLSIDLWIDQTGAHAKIVVVRLLGGRDWWPYGVQRLSDMSREHGIALALLPGEDRDDPSLAAASTLPPAELDLLLRYFREGGVANMRGLLRRLAGHADCRLPGPPPNRMPRCCGYLPGRGPVELEHLVEPEHLTESLAPDNPVVPIVFYRSMLLAGDTTPVDALCAALRERGLTPAPLAVPSLKDAEAATFLRDAWERLKPAAIVTTTAFAASAEPGEPTPLDTGDAPVLQAIIATTRRPAWQASVRGLGAADLAMHIVLPELDGRVLAGAVSFKDETGPTESCLGFASLAGRPEPDCLERTADRIAALVELQRTPRAARRIAVLLPDYPGASGRAGYAVGLDVPASVLALLADLAAAGYGVTGIPQNTRALLDALTPSASGSLSLARYAALLKAQPETVQAGIAAAWGTPHQDPDIRESAFRFRAKAFGNVLVAFAPDRGRGTDRRADYHDPTLPPRHALLAFGLWLRQAAFEGAGIDALVHMGAHGTLEWLPGKAVALTPGCFPEAVVGPVPVIYPFIVSNPGEAAQAKRRIGAVTLGHVPPPLVDAGLAGDARELERLVDEYAMADGLDRRRRERLATLILDTASRSGLACEAGADDESDTGQALRRIDSWLCDLKDLAIKDGQHIYGRPPLAGEVDPAWPVAAASERAAIITALDGKRVAPGPAGSPARGRRDVLPTGRNLFSTDPRTLPTQTAFDLGRRAAAEIVRNHLQQHGEMPRSLVLDLWGSASLRTGGEEIAQGLALLGCRPLWDEATGRVTGIEVLPPAVLETPRVDVTWRISGLFRDLFPAQIALLDAAVQAVAARAESDEDNPLAAAVRAGVPLARLFGSAPGAYGAGVEGLLGTDAHRNALGEAYLDGASHAYGGSAGEPTLAPGAFAARVAAADLLVHAGDDPGRDLLEGAADVAHIGGFASAAALLGRAPDLVMLDTTRPERPRVRSLAAALARIVRSRAVHPRFIAGQMRHGPRGAAELAETVDRLVAFAETTQAVSGTLLDLVHNAYIGAPPVRAFLLRESPAAAGAIAARLAAARAKGLWHPRRNEVDAELAMLAAEAAT
ncbi:MAG TPA: cobaltochelatase subunit CobN [Stellaceae bacterium]|jgi:cobaltochelatase CobN|nr:cobaltochelatase subunit CobN [Stellaceae bacterium]